MRLRCQSWIKAGSHGFCLLVLFCSALCGSLTEAAEERIEVSFPLPQGVIHLVSATDEKGGNVTTMTWNAHGRNTELLHELRSKHPLTPHWTVDAAIFSGSSLSMLRSSAYSASEYWGFKKDVHSGQWTLVARAHLGAHSMTWLKKSFVDPVRFEITRQTGEVDLYEVLDRPLRGELAGSIHRTLLENGAEFIPPGMMTRDQFGEALKKFSSRQQTE